MHEIWDFVQGPYSENELIDVKEFVSFFWNPWNSNKLRKTEFELGSPDLKKEICQYDPQLGYTINLSGKSLNKFNVAFSSIKTQATFHSLNLANTMLEHTTLCAFLCSLNDKGIKIREVNLDGNSIGTYGATEIAWLMRSCELRILSLRNNVLLGNDGLICVLQAASKSSSLTQLSFGLVGFNLTNMQEVYSALDLSHSLLTLDLIPFAYPSEAQEKINDILDRNLKNFHARYEMVKTNNFSHFTLPDCQMLHSQLKALPLKNEKGDIILDRDDKELLLKRIEIHIGINFVRLFGIAKCNYLSPQLANVQDLNQEIFSHLAFEDIPTPKPPDFIDTITREVSIALKKTRNSLSELGSYWARGSN